MSSPLSGDALLNPDLLGRFSERIRESLERKPVELEPAAHRRRIADLLARVGELTHYELLEVDPSAGGDEIYDAYLERARLVHPSHVPRLSMEGLAIGPEILFERTTLAYLTLSDEMRRLDYNVEIDFPPSGTVDVPVGEQRAAEERQLAARNFELAGRLADQEEFFYAIELLQIAVRLDPRAEYLALLGRCQSENPKWLRRAIKSYSRAIELDPTEHAWRLEMGSLLEREGNTAMARRQYREVLELVPGHPDAVAGIKRLK